MGGIDDGIREPTGYRTVDDTVRPIWFLTSCRIATHGILTSFADRIEIVRSSHFFNPR